MMSMLEKQHKPLACCFMSNCFELTTANEGKWQFINHALCEVIGSRRPRRTTDDSLVLFVVAHVVVFPNNGNEAKCLLTGYQMP